LTLRVPNANRAAKAASNSEVDFAGSTANDSFNVVPTPEGFEFSATLANANAAATYQLALNTHGLVASLDPDGMTIDVTDPTAIDPTAIVGMISAPALQQATGGAVDPSEITVSLDPSASSLRPDETMLTYTINPTWLHDPARAFPVVLDPTVCMAYAYTYCTASTTTTDTFVMNGSAYAGKHQSGWTVDRVGTSVQGDGYGVMRTLLWWNLPVIPDGNVITAADVVVGQYWNGGTAGEKIHGTLNASGFNMSTYWANKPSLYGSVTTPSLNACASRNCWLDFNATTLARAWYGHAGNATNFGITLSLDTETQGELQLDNYTNSTDYRHPQLEITYVPSGYKMTFDPALGPDFAPSTMVAGGTMTLPVNVTNIATDASGNWGNCSGTGSTPADCWSLGYRWYTPNGTLDSSAKTSIPAGVTFGNQTGVMNLAVAHPAGGVGQYTLRLDMVHTLNGLDLWSSDYAYQSLYYARAKVSSSPSNVHWGGLSSVERDEYPISVVNSLPSGGTTQSVSLPDGSSAAIDLWTKNLTYRGSTGLGFADLGTSISLNWFYSAADINSLAGITGANGWYTNYDERIEPGTGGATYAYRDSGDNVHPVNNSGDGALTSGTAARLDRPRITVFDDNTIPGTWTNATPTLTTTQKKSGTSSMSIPAGTTGMGAYIPVHAGPVTIPLPSNPPAISLNEYPNVSFAVQTSSDSGVGMGFDVGDMTTGVAHWLVYTVGADWTLPSGYLKVNKPSQSPIGTWVTVQDNLLSSVIAGLGSNPTDTYVVTYIGLVGRGGTGTDYFDAISLQGGSKSLLASPAWNIGSANASTETTDLNPNDSAASAFQVKAATFAASPTCYSTCSVGGAALSVSLGSNPYATWGWKKIGGSTLAVSFHVFDARTNDAGNWITYYAGPTAPPGAPNAIQVSPTVPTNWTTVTRNVLEDARQLFSYYNDNPGGTAANSATGNLPPTPDGVTLTGFALDGGDAGSALFDPVNIQTLPNVGGTQAGQLAGDDFLVTYANNEVHHFNGDGIQTTITDGNGNATRLTWTYSTSLPQSSWKWSGSPYSLAKVLAPSDGSAMADGTVGAIRRLSVSANPSPCLLSGATSCLRFTEQFGANGTTETGRSAEFDLGANSDLAAIVPSRLGGSCATSEPSGCAEFGYSGTTHLLGYVYDARGIGGAGADNGKATTIAYDGSNHPTSISDAAGTKLHVYASTTSGAYVRAAWQDANDVLAGTSSYVDLTPNGGEVRSWAPTSCGGCTSAGTPGDLLAAYETDGVGAYTSQIKYRTGQSGVCTLDLLNPTPAPGSCGNPEVTRTGTLAARAIDNYGDPIGGGETAWSQSAEQYATSYAAGSPDLYRTSYSYDGFGRTLDTITPNQIDASTYATQVMATPGLSHYYRLGDTGTTATDKVGSAGNGTISGATTGASGALVHDSDKALTFNGTSSYVQTTTDPITGTFSIEAWVKPSSLASTAMTIAGSRGGNDHSFDMMIQSGQGQMGVHSDIGNGTMWLTTTADALFKVVVDQWYQIVYVVTPDGWTVYVNGRQMNSGRFEIATGTPMLTDATRPLMIGKTGLSAYPYYIAGSIDEFAIYTAALDAHTVAAHYAAAGATALDDAQTLYDKSGNPIQTFDNFIGNPGFEQGLSGWGNSGASLTSPGAASSQTAVNLGAGGSVSQAVQILPGQKVRLQFGLSESASANAQIAVATDSGGGTYSAVSGTPLADPSPSTSWHTVAWDVALPMATTGLVKLTISNVGTGTVSLDDVAIFTTFGAITYVTDAQLKTNGLPASQKAISGATGSGATATTTLSYGVPDGAVTPAIFATSVTANSTTGSGPDQNVTTSRSFDQWGRTLASVDADGVATMTQYAPNQTDVATSSDGLGDITRTLTWDADGNATSTSDPLGNITTTIYAFSGKPLDVIAPDGSITETIYDAANRLVSTDLNHNGPVAPANVTTTNSYDTYGNVLTTVADAGTGPNFANAATINTYDLAGDLVTKTVYPDPYTVPYTGSPARTTTSHFDAAGTATATQAAIPVTAAPALLCPDSTTQRCNSVSVVDINGRTIDSWDAYGVRSHTSYDLAGHAVRTIANYVPGGNYTSSQNIVTDTTYDAAARPLTVTTYLVATSTGYPALSSATAYVTSTSYDALGRSVSVVRPDDSWIHTAYTKAGRTDRVSRPGSSTQTDADVAWTRNLYDAAGRQTTTLSNYTNSANAGFQLTSFESGTVEGFNGATNWANNAPASFGATLGTASSGSANTGFGALTFTTSASTQNGGVSLLLSGTFVAGHTYKAVAYAKGDTTGQSWLIVLGSGSSDHGTAVLTNSATAFTPLSTTWTPASTATGTVRVGFWGNYGQSQANTVHIDDVEVWDTATPTANIPSLTVYDADGHPVASVLPGGLAGDPPMVTRTGFDTLGRATDVTVDAAAGAGTGASDVNLNTHSAFDGLGRKNDTIDPAGHETSAAYDRLGHLVSSIADPGSSPHLNVTALAAYDNLGEAVATCSGNATAAASSPCTSTNITSSPRAWQYFYDLMGHEVQAVPPVNTTLAALDQTVAIYDTGGRVTSTVSCPASFTVLTCAANADRHTDTPTTSPNPAYDALGRVTSSATYVGTTTSNPQISSTTVYDSMSRKLSAQFSGSAQANPDTIEYTYGPLNRVTAMFEGTHAPGGGNAQTEGATYNPDGTTATRTDFAISSTASVFTYDTLGRLTNATSPTFGAGASVGFTWRLDGLMASRSWSTGPATLVYGYDGAKRPVSECNGTAGACPGAPIDIERTYDPVGNVTNETQNITGSDDTQKGTESFTYDALNRVLIGTLGSTTKTYTYDSDGNRLTVTVSGSPAVIDTFTFDTTDETISDTHGGDPIAFTYDRYGNLLTSSTSVASTTTYAYDLADRLNSITAADGSTVGFTFDAAGRHATRTAGTGANTTTLDTYSYLGSTDTALVDVSTAPGATTLDSGIDAIGDRLSTSTPAGGFAWIVPDLHGNVVAQCSSGGTVTDAFRYDAYGNLIGNTMTTGVASPWRFQGRILESTTGSATYDFGARAYVPDLGTFTSLDSVTGSAQNPLTLNRYLYADANPATLVDPDGHCARVVDGDCINGTARTQEDRARTPIIRTLHFSSSHILVDKNDVAVVPGDVASGTYGCEGRQDGGVGYSTDYCNVAAATQAKESADFSAWCSSSSDHQSECNKFHDAQSQALLLGIATGSELALTAFFWALAAGPDEATAAADSSNLAKMNEIEAEIEADLGPDSNLAATIKDSIWSKTAQARGMAYEDSSVDQGNRLPPNFKTFDEWNPKTATATSIKTIDLGADSYQKASGLRSLVRGFVKDALNPDYSDERGGVQLTYSMISNRVVRIGVPPGMSATQEDVLREMTQEAAGQNVTIIVEEVQ
jgi:RHS repeat-associated protein